MLFTHLELKKIMINLVFKNFGFGINVKGSVGKQWMFLSLLIYQGCITVTPT